MSFASDQWLSELGRTVAGRIPEPVGAEDTLWTGDDLSGFTTVTVSGTQAITEQAGMLSVMFDGQTAEDWNCVVKPVSFSVGDEWIVPLRLFGSTPASGAQQSAGLIFTDGTTSAANFVSGILLTSSADQFGRVVGRFGTLTADAGGVGGVRLAGNAWPWLYVRLNYVAANSFGATFSPDGVSWSSLAASSPISISKTMTPTHVGLCWQESTDTRHPVATFGPLQKL